MKRLALLFVIPILISAAKVEAGPLDVVVIEGVVTDPLGRPLSSVTVANLVTGRVSHSGADGRYTIAEDYVGTYRVRASRGGLNTSEVREVLVPTWVVTPIGPVRLSEEVDFVLTYAIGTSVNPASFHNTGNVEIQVEASTYNSGPSCVFLVDETSQTRADMTGTVSGGLTMWQGDLAIPADRPPGKYEVSVRGTDCESTLLTEIEIEKYRILEGSA